MYSEFEYESIPLKDIALDDKNPRIVTQEKLNSEAEIVEYLFEYENLLKFINKIAFEGKNRGAERPYVVKTGSNYTVIEGNRRIAAYRILTGLIYPPEKYASTIPDISDDEKSNLLSVDCSIAPNRDALLSIMASSHFGLGDKSRWGYLGSRKAVYDEWNAGRSISHLADIFASTEGKIRNLILEYLLYLEALKLSWTKKEKEALLNPLIEFNPPVRFLQTHGHKEKMAISYDKNNIRIVFSKSEAKQKFKHLLLRLVINPQPGLGATSSYDAVFADYHTSAGTTKGGLGHTQAGSAGHAGNKSSSASGTASGSGNATTLSPKPKSGALFSYQVTITNKLISQLMKEARNINCKTFPSAGTFLLRNIVEAILKNVIYEHNANSENKILSLENCLHICLQKSVNIKKEDKKILSAFKKDHLDYLNLGAHGNVIPNTDRLFAARDCIDQFVKRNV